MTAFSVPTVVVGLMLTEMLSGSEAPLAVWPPLMFSQPVVADWYWIDAVQA
jgi:hypothetical protein